MTTECARVGDVLSLHRREVTIDPTTEYRLVGVYSFGKGIFHREPKVGAELGDYRFFAIEPGDLVLSNIQAWEGAIGLASHRDAGTIGTHRFLSYVPVADRIDTDWARWFFLSEPGMRLIRQAAPGTTVRNRTLSIDRFESLEIPLPAIDEQRRVAQQLDGVEVAAMELRRRMKRAESLSNALAVSAVTRPELSGEAKAVAGWRRVRLEEVLTEHLEAVPVEPQASYEVVGVYSFGRGLFKRAELEGTATSYKALHRLHAGQLVLSRLKAWEGAIAIVPNTFDGWFLSPEFPTFDIDTTCIDTEYLRSLVTTEEFWARLGGASRGIGARRERVHAARLLEQEVDLPPLAVQRHVAEGIRSLNDADARRSAARDRIDALLPAAVNEAFASLS